MTIHSGGTGSRRRFIPSAAAVVFTELPRSGPFASQSQTLIAGLSNLTISADTAAAYSDQDNPLKYGTVTINAAKQWYANILTGNQAIYLWCNTLVLNGAMVNGGGDGGTAVYPNGGNGGGGASGGLGGSGATIPCDPCGSGSPGTGGTSAWVAPTYAFPSGGFTGATCQGPGPGYGEGGYGSTAGGDTTVAGGGAGGGPGIVCIVANTITGSATSLLQSVGGSPGLDSDSDVFASGGAGGVVWVAARSYNGLISLARVQVTGGTGAGDGTSVISQINTNLSLTTKAFNQSWVAT